MANPATLQAEEKDVKAQSGPSTPDTEQQKQAVNEDEEQWITGFRLWVVSAALCLVCFLMLLDISVLGTATPKITSEFHSLDNIGWYGAAYQLSSATLQPLTGRIYSNFNLKWTFFAFFLIFELGSLLCAVSVSSNMLIIGRAVAGMGGSGLINGALTIVAAIAPMPKRPMLIGTVIGIGQLGLVCGPLIGGLFTQYVTWRWCFYINLPLGGLVAILLALQRVPEQTAKPPVSQILKNLHHKLDLVGFVLFAPGPIMLLLAVQWGGNEYAWNSATVIGLLCGSVGMLLIWSAWNYHKGNAAMIPFPMLRKRYVWSSCVLSCCIMSAMFITSYYLPIYFQGVRGKSAALSGVCLLPSILGQIIAAMLAGRLCSKFGYYLPWSVVSAVLACIGYGLISTLRPNSSIGTWLGYQILFGFGRGLGQAMPIVAVQNLSQRSEMPVAMALTTFSQTMGGALFLSFADTIFTNSLRSRLDNVPGVNVEEIIADGAYTSLRSKLPSSSLNLVLRAYSQSIDNVFLMCVGLAGVCFFVSFATGWVDIRKKQPALAKIPVEEELASPAT